MKMISRAFLIYLLLLVLAIPLGVVTWVAFGPTVAVLATQGGVALTVFGTFAWVVIWDSRSRWPEAGVRERASRVLSFER